MPQIGGGRRGGGGGSRETLRAGTYLLALTWFQRKRSDRSGTEYLSCKFTVVGGAAKGKGFFGLLNLDFTRPGTVKRWEMYMDACGVTETPIELGSYEEGTDLVGDENIRRLFRDVPFGAEVKVERQGQYENNDLGRFVFPKQWAPQWQEWAREYGDRQRSRGAPENYADPYAGGDGQRAAPDQYGDPEPLPAGGDEYDPGAGGFDDGFADPPPARTRKPADDDDIPF